ncbi:MAG: chorismate-binding protein, partial [Bacteriovoracaceae bacterium]|nr:chorismate-binding protein [Bacteriovoracaceae bacterium]
ISKLDFFELIGHFEETDLPRVSESLNRDHNFVKDIDNYLLSDTALIKKCVPCTREEYLHSDKIHPFHFFKQIKSSFTDGYLYGKWDSDSGFIGVTPEPALIRRKNEYTTYSIAGTSRFPDDLNSEKMIDEQEQVTIDISNTLNQNGVTDLSKESKYVDANGLIHRQTEIKFNAAPDRFKNILKALTPTGALGVLPKSKLEYLKQLDYYHHDKEQRIYGGNFIIRTEDVEMALVMIRSTQWKKDHSWIDTGCGITPLSSSNDELSEALIKRKTVKKLFYETVN